MTQDTESQPARKQAPPPPASWASLPHKGQLALICSVRVVDFFQQAALQTYMVYQLKSFAPDAPDTTISFQAGVLQGVFTAAQIFTGILWGRVADQPWSGRKTVLLIGLTGQGLACCGVAFARSFATAAVWRCLGGAVNATVGGARTALAETTEKRFHSRTFLLLPLAFNIANIFGPILGGLLSDPFKTYPYLFGEDSTFGGDDGITWLKTFPYAAPNLLCASLLFLDAFLIWLFLRETLASRQYTRDRGLEFADQIRYRLSRAFTGRLGYSQVQQQQSFVDGPDMPPDDDEVETSTPLRPLHSPQRQSSLSSSSPLDKELTTSTPDDHRQHQLSTSFAPKASSLPSPTKPRPAPPFYHALTPNVLLVMSTVAFMDFQMGGFASLWTIFLSSAKRSPTDSPPVSLPFHFTGGLGFSPSTIGFAMSILGFIGILLQLTVYPRVNARYGLLRSTKWSLFVFPLAYFLAPYLSLLTGQSMILWLGIIGVLLLQVGARTFSLPGSILLINNSSPGPQLLGTVHGMGAATSSAFRTVGPIVAGHWYARGLEGGMVGLGWWGIAAVSVVGCAPVFWVRDGA